MPRYEPRDLVGLLRSPVGRREALDALAQGAWPLLRPLARAYRRRVVRRTATVAVVGSLGKTTTTRAVAAALGCELQPFSRRNCESFLAGNLLTIRPGQRHAVVEVGINNVGRMAPYAAMVQPDLVVVTCIGSEHNRSLGTLEVTRQEKAEMVRALDSSGVAVLNSDDPNVAWMASQSRARVVTYGTGEAADVRAHRIRDWSPGQRGVSFDLSLRGVPRSCAVESRLIGRHQVSALLAAAAVGLAFGRDLQGVIAALEALPPTAGRLQPVRLSEGGVVLRDDFKSSLETIERAFDVMEALPATTRKVVVLGEVTEPPGSTGPVYRDLGARLSAFASRVVVVSGRKSFSSYVAGAARAGMERRRLARATDVLDAVRLLKEAGALCPGAVVLIKGRNQQKLERVAVALEGRPVYCALRRCRARIGSCADCPMLARGWHGSEPVI